MQTYFNRPEISNSDLTYIKKSIQDYLWYKANPPKPTAEMLFGKLVHQLILEPNREILINETASRNTKDYQNQVLLNPNKDVYLRNEVEEATQIRDVVLSNQYAAELLLNGQAEQDLFFTYNDVPCRSRIDYLGDSIVDLKTIDSIENIHYSMKKYSYYRQQVFYQKAVKEVTGKSLDFYFIFVEKKAPYKIKIIDVDPYSNNLIDAKNEIATLLELYKSYLNNNDPLIGYEYYETIQ